MSFLTFSSQEKKILFLTGPEDNIIRVREKNTLKSPLQNFIHRRDVRVSGSVSG
jgi:hypothetical protein